jgi:hypothetical protein
MRIRREFAPLVLLVAAGIWSAAWAADEKPKKEMEGHSHSATDAKAAPMDAAAMDAMQKAMAPGENHKRLDYFVGNWKTENTMWMGPGEPMKSEGTVHYEWVLGGRYLQSTFTGSFMDQPFQGMALDGYDNTTGQYFSLWLDNAGTGYLLSHGQRSADGKQFTFTGTAPDPASKKPVKHRMISTIKDKDSFLFEMFTTQQGQKESKVMEIKYSRVAS